MPKLPAFTRLIRKHKLEHHRETIEAGYLPAVRMTYRFRPNPPVPPGGSKFGGEPDLHWSEPWPSQDGRPLHFLAQIQLSEANKHLPKGLLPPRGRMTLWYNSLGEKKQDERTIIRTADFDPSLLLLLFDPDESPTVQRRTWPSYCETFRHSDMDDWAPYPETPIMFRPLHTLAQAAINQVLAAEEAAAPDDGFDRFQGFLLELEQAGYRFDGAHRMLGDVWQMQSDNRFAAACMAAGVSEFANRSDAEERRLQKEAKRYCLLIMLDSDDRGPGFSWGDGGSLQWWIRDDHLTSGRLQNAVGIYEQGA
jgi:uncharacterized protein YwqG